MGRMQLRKIHTPRPLNNTIVGIMKTRLYKYSENLPQKKNENFQIKNSDIFYISAQNIDCGYSLEPPRRDGSNGYRQSMFWAEIRKIMNTPVNPSFTVQKWGLRGSKSYRHVFVMGVHNINRVN